MSNTTSDLIDFLNTTGPKQSIFYKINKKLKLNLNLFKKKKPPRVIILPTLDYVVDNNVNLHNRLSNLIHTTNILRNCLSLEHKRRVAAELRALQAEDRERLILERLSRYE